MLRRRKKKKKNEKKKKKWVHQKRRGRESCDIREIKTCRTIN